MSIADQMRAEARAASAKSLPSINPDELNAALATIEPTTAAAEPVTPNLGALTPSRPPSGSCEEQKKTNHNTAGHCDWRSTRME